MKLSKQQAINKQLDIINSEKKGRRDYLNMETAPFLRNIVDDVSDENIKKAKRKLSRMFGK